MRKKDKTFERILLFIALSLLLHVGFGVFFYNLHGSRQAMPPPTRQEVVFVNPQDVIQEPATGQRPMEIADIAKPKVQKAPKKARFAAQYNSSVEQQTVAKRIPKRAQLKTEVSEDEGEKGKGEEPKKSPPLAMKAKEEASPPQGASPPEEKSKEEDKPKKEVSLADLSLKPSDFKDLLPKEKKSSEKVAMRSKESESFSPGRPGTSGAPDRFVHDFFPDVKIGGKTYLNTAAFPDVQYFTQLKRVFRMRFNPEPPLRHHLAGNRLVLGKVNVTMAVTVSRSGQLSELFVVKSSGIPGYDREALETIRESSPFNAPPQKVLDKDGVLRMTWSFITYL